MSPGLQARLLQGLLRRARRRGREVGEVVGALRVRDDLGERLLAVGRRPLLRGQHERAAAVVDAGRVARRVRALLAHQPRERRELLERRVPAGALVDLDDRVALAALDVTDTISSDRRPSSVAFSAQLVRAQRPAVEIGAGHLELVADLGRLDEHLLARERVGEPVVDHRVEHLRVAHAVAEARLRQQIRSLGHRLHAPADADLQVAGADRLVEDHRRAQPRGADLVDRLRGDLLGDAGLDLGLARGNLSLAGLQHLAHHDVLDLLGLDPGALERRPDRHRAELGGVERGQAAAHLADRGAGGAEDHGLGHEGRTLLVCR